MLSWPSSHRIRYRGDGSPRTTSSTTPERGRRSVDSDSATTRLPTSKGMLTPSVLVLAEHRRRQASVTTTSGRSHHPNVARPRWPPVGGWMFRRRAVGPQRSCRRSESGAHNRSIEGRCRRGCLDVESRGTVADQAVRVARFLLADLIGLRLRRVPCGTAKVKDITPKDRGQAGDHMSRSTASPPPEQGAPSEGRPPRERSDDHERQAMRPQRVSASFAGRADGAQERVVNVCARWPPPGQSPVKPFGGAFQC